MASTVSLVQMLAAGMTTSAGLPLASGRCRFYLPGTLTPVSVYADSAAATPVSPPLILTAGGTGVAYTKVPTRMIVKTADDVTTVFDGLVNIERADQQFIQSAAINGGAETTLQALLDGWSAAFGGSTGLWTYKAYSDAVERNVKDVISEIQVSVKSYGAVGDGIADDTTAIQNTVARVVTNGGGVVFFPPGTYLTSLEITVANAGVDILGSGLRATFIKATGAAQNALNFTASATTTFGNRVSRIGFTHATTTTGSAIVGNSLDIDSVNVATSRYRYGITASGGVFLVTNSIIIGNAADASCIPVNVTGALDFVMTGCFVTKPGTGQACVQIASQPAVLSGNVIDSTGSATSDGIKLTSIAGAFITGNYIIGVVNAVNVTAGAAILTGNNMVGGTHGVNIAASGASARIAQGQIISPDILDSRTAAIAPVGYSFSTSTNFTPLPLQTDTIRVIATAAITVTIDAPAAGRFGQDLTIFQINSSGGAVTWTYNAIFKLQGGAAAAPSTGNLIASLFKYDPVSLKWREVSRSAEIPI